MRRVLVLGWIIYILLILALAGTNGTLLALILPFMIYLGIGFIFNPSRLSIETSRSLSRERALQGDEIDIQLNLTNHGSNIELLDIKDQVPTGLTVIQGENQILTSLSQGESITLTYTVTGHRGLYDFSCVEIAACDTLQVHAHHMQIKTGGQLFIQPTPLRLGHLEIRPRGTRVYAGHIPARTGGPGVEFFGVREYQQGDPLRWINWRASARYGQKFIINEFEQERVADVGIILDTRQRSQIVLESDESLFEFSVQAASALAETFLKDGNRVGLLLYGTLLDWTLPDYGKLQLERILKRLSAAKPGESLVFDELENLPTKLLPPKSQIIFISPLQTSDLPVLVGLRARGYAVMIISPNPILFERANMKNEGQDLLMAVRLAGLERLLMLKKLRIAGIQVLDWHTSVPLEQALSALSSQPISLRLALE